MSLCVHTEGKNCYRNEDRQVSSWQNSILNMTKELIFKRISYYTYMQTKSIKYKPRCVTEENKHMISDKRKHSRKTQRQGRYVSATSPGLLTRAERGSLVFIALGV